MTNTASQSGETGDDAHPGYFACVLGVNGYPHVRYADDYFRTFGGTGWRSRPLSHDRDSPEGQTYITLRWSHTTGLYGPTIRLEHHYVWQRFGHVLAQTLLPIRNIRTTPTIRTFASADLTSAPPGTTEYSEISFDIDYDYCGHWIDRDLVGRLEGYGCQEAAEVQTGFSAPFWDDDDWVEVRHVSILLWVHSPDAMTFKDDFMTIWNHMRKDPVVDVAMGPRAHPFLLDVDSHLTDTTVQSSLPVEPTPCTSLEPDDRIKARRAKIVADLIEDAEKKIAQYAERAEAEYLRGVSKVSSSI